MLHGLTLVMPDGDRRPSRVEAINGLKAEWWAMRQGPFHHPSRSGCSTRMASLHVQVHFEANNAFMNGQVGTRTHTATGCTHGLRAHLERPSAAHQDSATCYAPNSERWFESPAPSSASHPGEKCGARPMARTAFVCTESGPSVNTPGSVKLILVIDPEQVGLKPEAHFIRLVSKSKSSNCCAGPKWPSGRDGPDGPLEKFPREQVTCEAAGRVNIAKQSRPRKAESAQDR